MHSLLDSCGVGLVCLVSLACLVFEALKAAAFHQRARFGRRSKCFCFGDHGVEGVLGTGCSSGEFVGKPLTTTMMFCFLTANYLDVVEKWNVSTKKIDDE